MRVYVVFKAVTRNWLRSRSGLFFSFLFPVVLLFLLGSISQGPGGQQVGGQDAPGYYLASLTAAFIMTNGVIGLTNVASELKRNGVIRRLSATPLTKLEWLVGNVLSQTVLALALATVMLVLGVGLYHATILVNLYSVGVLVLGAILFSGVGMSLAGMVKDPEAASGLGNVIAFPMMLLSGTFWPVSIMPTYLQSVSRFLPLTYFSDGLRDAMVTGDFPGALFDFAIMGAFAVALLFLGATVTRWKEQ